MRQEFDEGPRLSSINQSSMHQEVVGRKDASDKKSWEKPSFVVVGVNTTETQGVVGSDADPGFTDSQS